MATSARASGSRHRHARPPHRPTSSAGCSSSPRSSESKTPEPANAPAAISALPGQHAGPRPNFDVIAIASSAGGLAALTETLSGLPEDLPASLLVVQHLDPRHESLMATILSRRTSLSVKQAEESDRIEPGTVYIAPPNRHLLANPDRTLSLTQSELVHFVRPSADLLFESVAAAFRDRAIAVVLTGTGSDGAMGVKAIKTMGGTVIAQDEKTSEFFAMPSAAIDTGDVDFVLALEEIPPALVALVVGGS